MSKPIRGIWRPNGPMVPVVLPRGSDRRAEPGPGVGASRGQALVELALTLPILTMILMGIIDLSFVLYAHIQVAAASAEGARAGALYSGDLGLVLAQNDSGREQAIKQAVYNSGTGTTTMGLLTTSSPNFDVNTDVQVSYPNSTPADPTNTTRTGEEMVVSIVYRQTLWFDFLPGATAGAMQVGTGTRVRIQ